MGGQFSSGDPTSSSGKNQNKPTTISSRSVRSRVVENFILIWLDINKKVSSKTTQKSINQLHTIINSIRTFTDVDQCIRFIHSITDENMVLILSGGFNEDIISIVEDRIALKSIYIFSHRKTKHTAWIDNHQKIRGIFKTMETICNALEEDIPQWRIDVTPQDRLQSTKEVHMGLIMSLLAMPLSISATSYLLHIK